MSLYEHGAASVPTIGQHGVVTGPSPDGPVEHTTPVLVFDEDGGLRTMRRCAPDGAMTVFVHAIPGAAVFTLPPGDDRPLDAADLNLAAPFLRRYATRGGDFIEPILAFDGYPLSLGEPVDMGTSDPMVGHRFLWGNRSCALLLTKSVDSMLSVTTGQVYTYDAEWANAPSTVRDRIARWFLPRRTQH